MTAIVLADTGLLYAMVDPSDQFHRRAQREAARLQRDRVEVAVPYPILFEAYTLIMRRLGLAIGHRWLRQMRGGAGLINPTPLDYEEAFRVATQFADQQLSLFDTVLAVLSKRLGLPVWTFDHHLELVGAVAWRAPSLAEPHGE